MIGELDESKILSIPNMVKSIFLNLKYYYEYNNNFEENMINLTINGKKIVTKLNVNSIRKKINFNTNIYAIMTEEMINNINNPNNIQYFNDIIYYAIPPNKNHYKIYILMVFNKDLYKTIICNISLISNENKEKKPS